MAGRRPTWALGRPALRLGDDPSSSHSTVRASRGLVPGWCEPQLGSGGGPEPTVVVDHDLEALSGEAFEQGVGALGELSGSR